ncbi:MAG: hypothetical protein LBV23_02870 [Deltaproteobacteria bacterium]|nr:hypothetical protein [Deltaproteobacteria bacterium]
MLPALFYCASRQTPSLGYHCQAWSERFTILVTPRSGARHTSTTLP